VTARRQALLTLAAGALGRPAEALAAAAPATPTQARWLREFQPSTLSAAEQLRELQWFAQAAEPFRGQRIKVLSEIIDTHVYESRTLARAFSELTGIQVEHELLPEGDVVRRLRAQLFEGQPGYDAYDQRQRPDRHALALRAHLHHRRPMESCTSCPTSSSPTCTGSAPTCSTRKDI
jgi:glycerol transport system substrate-binding protein